MVSALRHFMPFVIFEPDDHAKDAGMPNPLVPGHPLQPALPEATLPGHESQPGNPPPTRTPAATLTRAIAALRRFRWLIVGLTLMGLGGGWVATRFIQPDYQIEAKIWIETQPQGRAGAPIQGEGLLASRAWVELLTAFKVLDPVVHERRLYLSFASPGDTTLFQDFDLAGRILTGRFELSIDKNGKTYDLRQRVGLYNESGAVGDSVGRQIGFRWVPRPLRSDWGRKVRFEIVTPREASAGLAKRLQPVLKEERFLVLRLNDKSGEAGAATLNALIKRFVNEAAEQKRAKLTLLAQVLDSQVLDQEKRLKDAEQRLESFRVGTVTKPREDVPIAPGLQFTQPTVYSNYFMQRAAADSLRRDRQEIEDVLRRSREGEFAVDAFNTITSVKMAPDLQRVLGELSTMEANLRDSLARYTEEYKGVQNLRDRISILRSRTIPIYADALIRQIQIREGELNTRISTASRDLQEIPVRTQTENRLRREVDQADLLYRSLDASRQQAKLAEASAIPDVRILDPAEAPSNPSRNSSSSLIFLGLILGLGVGVGLTLLLDRFDPRLRYPDQVSTGLGLPILGTIPEIKRAKGMQAGHEEAGQVVEAFRSIRMSLAHSFDSAGPIILTISSPAPGDGKSLIASNLALSFAEAGYRTVLMDGDIRRGALHHTFGAERRPGLVDHLAGDASVAAMLRPGTHPLLTLVPCGSRRHLGPELLGTARMHELIEQLKRDFQVIIVDTPPLGAGIDPFVLSTVTGHLALVLRAGETDRQLAEAKLQILDRLPVRLLGAILNDVSLKEGAYKYYRYSYGYAVEFEEEPETAQLQSGKQPG